MTSPTQERKELPAAHHNRRGTTIAVWVLALAAVAAVILLVMGKLTETTRADSATNSAQSLAEQVKSACARGDVSVASLCQKGEEVAATPAPGAPGATGPAGATGQPGPPGERGATGATGATGAQGEPGPAGPVGPKGDTGLGGTAGTNGTNGQDGTAGAKGDTGAQGPAGPAGKDGASGPPPGRFTWSWTEGLTTYTATCTYDPVSTTYNCETTSAP